ncbi:hypothetical protein SAY87_017897 [Trapa incisa]|uniref:IMS import disulfide relay-system CHCH-CHCH-like Cx9C domain-containing protein n=1 Tax=Trapa incisa TaxID=236973 RepID=A0AAN7QVS1_9MYRT|nr:hypothetical protein SAY87_017897 [Trapa incisa]
MGRKSGGIYINPKKFGSLSKPCMKEMVSFLNCLALNRSDDNKCVRHKDLLNACMDAQLHFDMVVVSFESETLWIYEVLLLFEHYELLVQSDKESAIASSRFRVYYVDRGRVRRADII